MNSRDAANLDPVRVHHVGGRFTQVRSSERWNLGSVGSGKVSGVGCAESVLFVRNLNRAFDGRYFSEVFGADVDPNESTKRACELEKIPGRLEIREAWRENRVHAIRIGSVLHASAKHEDMAPNVTITVECACTAFPVISLILDRSKADRSRGEFSSLSIFQFASNEELSGVV